MRKPRRTPSSERNYSKDVEQGKSVNRRLARPSHVKIQATHQDVREWRAEDAQTRFDMVKWGEMCDAVFGVPDAGPAPPAAVEPAQ